MGCPTSACSLGTPGGQPATGGGSPGSSRGEHRAPGRWRLLLTTPNPRRVSAGGGAQRRTLPFPAVPARDLWQGAAGHPWTPRPGTAGTGRRARLEWKTHPRAVRGWAVWLPRQAESDQAFPPSVREREWTHIAPRCPPRAAASVLVSSSLGQRERRKAGAGTMARQGRQQLLGPAQPRDSKPRCGLEKGFLCISGEEKQWRRGGGVCALGRALMVPPLGRRPF